MHSIAKVPSQRLICWKHPTKLERKICSRFQCANSDAQPGTSSLTKLFGFQTWGRFCERVWRYKDFQMIGLDVQSSCLKAQPAQPGNVQLHVEVADFFHISFQALASAIDSIDDIRPEKSRKCACGIVMMMLSCLCYIFVFLSPLNSKS